MKPADRHAVRRRFLRILDRDRLRRGDYSDEYFLNAARILRAASRAGRPFSGRSPALRDRGPRPALHHPGDAVVEIQFHARRRPRFLAAGIELAIAIAGTAARRTGTSPGLRAWAVPEGTLLRPRRPALILRARYRDVAHLETPMIGVLTRASRVATNVFEALSAARGKPIFFFPARFDIPHAQEVDGYAYRVALEAYASATGRRVPPQISTGAQGRLWPGRGTGTVPHAYILCFLGDTAEAMLAYCRHMPPDARRIALVDTTNDCVGESVRTARRLFGQYLERLRRGRISEARRFVLHGVRADTSQTLRDRSVPPSRDRLLERGVTPVLVRRMRDALDAQPDALVLPPRWRTVARRYFRSIRILASGGFDPERIALFERHRAPVDIYGIGSYFLRGASNDYTADIVRVRLGGRFRVVAKTGRAPGWSPELRPVRWS